MRLFLARLIQWMLSYSHTWWSTCSVPNVPSAKLLASCVPAEFYSREALSYHSRSLEFVNGSIADGIGKEKLSMAATSTRWIRHGGNP